MESSDITFTGTGNSRVSKNATMLKFWRWAFLDLCDDDIKGIFAEWMVGTLFGLPLASARRVSWADSDIVLPNGKRIEVKSSAVWQSWKLVNQDGTRKPFPAPIVLNPNRVRFCGLQARTSADQWAADDLKQFKSDHYVFCMQSQTDPAIWDAWNLEQWEFYMMTRDELIELKVGGSISLAALRNVRPSMSSVQVQEYARVSLGLMLVSWDNCHATSA